MAALKVSWPLITAMKKAECIQAFKEWPLDTEVLAKKVESSSRVQVWSHVKWVNNLANQVHDMEDKLAVLLTKVYNALPEPIDTTAVPTWYEQPPYKHHSTD